MSWIVLILLLAYLGGMFWFVKKKYNPKSLVTIAPVTAEESRHKLARSSYKVLHFVHGVLLFLTILWLPFALVILFHFNGNFGPLPELQVYTNMVVDLTQLEGIQVSGINEQIIKTKTEIALQAPDYINSFIFSVTQIFTLVLILFVVLQLRNILASLCNGDSFSGGNSQRLNWVGKVFVFAYLVGPIWKFFLSASVINTVKFSTPAITMTPTTDGSLIGLLVGVGILILSPVIKEAELLLDEQRHTI